MFTFLLVLQAIVAAALVTVILMQRSEGGGLGMGGGSPSGLMSARGAADFLTRATAVLAGFFVLLSIALATMAATRHSTTIDTSLARSAPVAPAGPTTAPPPDGAPFATAAQNAAAAAAGNAPADNGAVPLAQ